MGYNMRREFLLIHKELVNKFIELADTNGATAYTCNTPQDVTDTRYLFNNLLSSLAAWEPNKAYVRSIVRTWVTYDSDEQCHLLHVGVPVGGTRGRAPKILTPKQTLGATVIAPLIVDEITPDNGTQVMTQLAAAKYEQVPSITFITPPSLEGIEYITDKLAPEYVAVDATATPLIFERVR